MPEILRVGLGLGARVPEGGAKCDADRLGQQGEGPRPKPDIPPDFWCRALQRTREGLCRERKLLSGHPWAVSKVAETPTTEQLNLDFEGRAPPKAKAKAPRVRTPG
jgi:hypothetical protein